MTDARELEQNAGLESSGLALGLVAGALAAAPALARGVSVGLLGVALCSMALAAPVCLAFRTLGARWLTWLAITLSAAFVPLAFGAEWLVRTTHHRPLGAVTFAVFAVALLMFVGLLVRRAMPLLGKRKGFARLLLIGLLVIDVLLLVRARSSGVLEGVTWLVLVFLAALMPQATLRGLPGVRVQVAMWLLTLAGAALWALSAPDSLVQASAVLSFPLRALLGRA